MQVEALKDILKREGKRDLGGKSQLRQAKEDAVWEYRDSDAFLKELGVSFANSFGDYFHQEETNSDPQSDRDATQVD